MTDVRDEPMINGHGEESHLPLTDDEERVLALYDRLQELRLEIAIINAQQAHQTDEARNPTDEETRKAQSDLLEARAKYVLRNNVVDAVMMANPILKAVHNGINASPVERDLLPYVERRDSSAISAAKQAAESGRLWDELTRVQSEALRVSRDNMRLTAELFALADLAKRKQMGREDNPETRRDSEKLEGELRSSKQRWRVVKGVAAGVVAGSGVDWGSDDELRDIVLDPESEE
ncbi:Fc.00g063230.m01.CDS01 [Cosmosporella sp. VM-42]